MIDHRLSQWYGIDINKNIGLKSFCPKPFDTLLIDKNASCFLCDCTAWLPYSVGNIKLQNIEEIFQNKKADHIRNSIRDGSYRYCNEKQCAWLLDKVNAPEWPTQPRKVKIKNIRLAIDESCNLSCPSCRTKTIFVKDKIKIKKKIEITDKIIDFVQKQSEKITLHIGSDGDPFASIVYRDFFRKSKNCNNMNFTITTNGLLIKKMYQKNDHVFSRLQELNVSIDGATEKTYEKLRRGGKFDLLCENLEFLKKIKKENNFILRFHYVIQRDNFKEMTEMFNMGKKFLADSVWLNRITNWNTFKNFDQIDICNDNHSQHEEFVQELEKIKSLQRQDNTKFLEFPTLI